MRVRVREHVCLKEMKEDDWCGMEWWKGAGAREVFDPSVIAVRSLIGHKYYDFSYTYYISLSSQAHALMFSRRHGDSRDVRSVSSVNEFVKENSICVSMAMDY